MMPGVYIVVTSGLILLKTIGPLPYNIRECQARIELWTKLYLAPPTLMPNYERTYQCIEKLSTKRKGKK
jgi:hypothetical protein